MGRKGFPGKVGPEGVKVNKSHYLYLFFFPFDSISETNDQ